MLNFGGCNMSRRHHQELQCRSSPGRPATGWCHLSDSYRRKVLGMASKSLEVQRPMEKTVSPETILEVWNSYHPKLGTIILIVFDF